MTRDEQLHRSTNFIRRAESAARAASRRDLAASGGLDDDNKSYDGRRSMENVSEPR